MAGNSRIAALMVPLLAGVLALAGCSEAPSEQNQPVAAASVAAPAEPAGNPPLEAWLRGRYADMDTNLLYRSAEVDLDGDATAEVLAYVGGAGMCGTGGCPLHVLKVEPGGMREVTVTSVTQLPVGVLASETNGWRDLWVTVAGGGVPEAAVRLAFNGVTYPSNPTVPPAEPITTPGEVLIEAGELVPVPVLGQ